MSSTASPPRSTLRFLGKLLLSVKVVSVLLPTMLFSLSFVVSIVAASMGRLPWQDVFVSGLISAPLIALSWAIIDGRRKSLRSESNE